MKVLLHTCCGPCASACVARLKDEGYLVTLYFSNSNISTKEEFEKRLDSVRILAKTENVDVIVDDYKPEIWYKEAAEGFEMKPEKGARCARCFRFNLRQTSKYAANNGYDAFTTSLTVSPHKVSSIIFEEGKKAAEEFDSTFLEVDFKKKNGFKESVKRSCELGLYRQSFCGCKFSMRLEESRG